MLELGVNAEARRFSEPGAGIPHAGIFGGAGGKLPVLRYLSNAPTQNQGEFQNPPQRIMRAPEKQNQNFPESQKFFYMDQSKHGRAARHVYSRRERYLAFADDHGTCQAVVEETGYE